MTPSPSTQKSKVFKKNEVCKISIPPPIKVSNVSNFNTFRSQIKGVATNSVYFTASSNQDINITVSDENDYRNIKKHLLEMVQANKDEVNSPFNKMEFHTNQLKRKDGTE